MNGLGNFVSCSDSLGVEGLHVRFLTLQEDLEKLQKFKMQLNVTKGNKIFVIFSRLKVF